MSKSFATGIAPATHIHANNYIQLHTYIRADRPIITEAAAGPLVRVQILRIPLRTKGRIGNSNFSKVKVSSAELIVIKTKRFFNTGYKMAISLQISMLKVGYFL